MTDDLINALKKEQREDADTIEVLRAESVRLQMANDILRMRIGNAQFVIYCISFLSFVFVISTVVSCWK